MRITPHIRDQNIILNKSAPSGYKIINLATIEQVTHVKTENSTFKNLEYCSAIFLDATQGIGKVWLDSLMHKIRPTARVYA